MNHSKEQNNLAKVKYKKQTQKEMLIGFLVSFFATFCGLFLYVQYFSRYDFDTTLQLIQRGNMYAQILALSALPNLFVFLYTSRKNKTLELVGS